MGDFGDFGDRRGGYGDRREDFEDRRGDMGDRRGDMGDRRGDMGDRRGDFEDRRGNMGDRRGDFGERRGGYDSRRIPDYEDSRYSPPPRDEKEFRSSDRDFDYRGDDRADHYSYRYYLYIRSLSIFSLPFLPRAPPRTLTLVYPVSTLVLIQYPFTCSKPWGPDGTPQSPGTMPGMKTAPRNRSTVLHTLDSPAMTTLSFILQPE